MVITRRIPIDELLARTIRDLNITEPAGHPTEDELERRECMYYFRDRTTASLKRKARRSRNRGGALC